LGGDAEFGEEFTGLKFVDIHGKEAGLIHSPLSEEKNSLQGSVKKLNLAATPSLFSGSAVP
jgi:hypothetical protein